MNVCILSLAGYHVLSADAGVVHVGGAEVQIVAVARGLAKQGHNVSFVTLDHGQQDGVSVGGIRVFKAFAQGAGLPIVRFVLPRWTSVWGALSRANPDLCIQAAGDSWTGVAASWCRRNKKPFVFVSMSEGDCETRLPFLDTRRDRMLYRYGLRRADSVVVQTDVQRHMLRENFGLDGVVIRPCCATPTDSIAEPNGDAPPKALLWIGRYSTEKRLEWFLDIAEACPELTCLVVGGANEATDYADELAARIKTIPNVVAHGFVPHADIGPLYRKAGLLVTTSVIEGFPTTFMEAWARGVPTLGMVDPDGLIAEHGLGAVASDVPGLAREAQRLLGNEPAWRDCSARAKQFFDRNHSVDAGAAAYSKLLGSLTKRNGRCVVASSML